MSNNASSVPISIRWCEDVDVGTNTVKFDLDITCRVCESGEMVITVDVSDAVEPLQTHGFLLSLRHAVNLSSTPDMLLRHSVATDAALHPNEGFVAHAIDPTESLGQPGAAPSVATERSITIIERDLTLPRGVWEARIHDMWSELLGYRGFGVFSSFFEVGGDSLLAVRLSHKIRSEYVAPTPFVHGSVSVKNARHCVYLLKYCEPFISMATAISHVAHAIRWGSFRLMHVHIHTMIFTLTYMCTNVCGS